VYLGFDFHVCFVAENCPCHSCSVGCRQFFAKFVNASKRKRNGPGEEVGRFPLFVLHVAQDYHEISPRV
jgi:hypothetical protein